MKILSSPLKIIRRAGARIACIREVYGINLRGRAKLRKRLIRCLLLSSVGSSTTVLSERFLGGDMFIQRRTSKYGSERKEYNGRSYMSKKEAGYARDLDLLKRAGEIKDWKPQYKLSLDVNGYHICNYIVDFWILTKHDEEELHEVKGFETEVWRLKWKLTEAIYGKRYNLVVIK